jgi:uncharacterized protein (DUF1800 family)
MSLDPRGKAALALHRFGFGPRARTIDTIASDPMGALLADLERTNAGHLGGAGFLTAAQAAQQNYADQMQRKMDRIKRQKQARSAAPGPVSMEMGSTSESMQPKPKAEASSGPYLGARLYFAEAEARADAAISSDVGLVERLVWFWSNHFCIAAKKRPIRAIAGAFEREAIRPYVLGRFSDMLLAVEGHPAMLQYLDNARSIGPNSPRGRHRKRGLNENLAREILELHTLGVRTVYTQADVTNFAKVITGWTVVSPLVSSEHGGEFEFSAERHEPGSQTVVGKSYPDTGVEQGRTVLKDLARHPATAGHIATKLATHFIADTPPRSLVALLTKRFLDTNGDLKEVTKALLQSEDAWNAPRTKIKRPGEWIVTAMRAVNADAAHFRLVLQAQNMLGEPLWQPPSPKGFSDQNSEWIDGLAERLDIATNLSRRLEPAGSPRDLVEQTLGPLASPETRSAVARAEDRTQALTLLFMAPEFQLR